MVLKFEEFVNELFAKSVNRGLSGEKRLEEGKKVMTSIGVEIFLHNSTCDYEWFIKEFCDSGYTDDMKIEYYRPRDFKDDELKSIKSGEDPYRYEINNDVIIGFGQYDEMIDGSVFEESDLDEHDYISICKGIATAIKNINEEYEFVYINNYGGSDTYGFTTVKEQKLDEITDTIFNKISDYDEEWGRLKNQIAERYCTQFQKEHKYDIMVEGEYGSGLYATMAYSTLKLYKEIHKYTDDFLKNVFTYDFE